MEITIESRLSVLENQIEMLERTLNSRKLSDPAIDVLALHIELEELLYAKIKLLEEKNRQKEKEFSSIH